MEEVGDEDIVICDNVARALYLSLKYEFVTPLTSLVVVKPDRANEAGDIGEAGTGPAKRTGSAPPVVKFNSAAKPRSSAAVIAAVSAVLLGVKSVLL